MVEGGPSDEWRNDVDAQSFDGWKKQLGGNQIAS